MEDERIEIDDRVGFGRPRIRGTRVPLDVLFARLAAGMAEADVAKEYGIDIGDVRAALLWVARRIASERA
ncbi:MAG TPA: DUF433 domain-containing protein [Candidatus Polarisedimenticolaceae bacterium]|nr:DUF433 domain-containing protein [Candidatus Polarisedimenticolaceae bacterium]